MRQKTETNGKGVAGKMFTVFFAIIMMAAVIPLISNGSDAADYDYIDIDMHSSELAENSEWDPDSHTLYLNGVNVRYINYNLSDPLNIVMQGENNIVKGDTRSGMRINSDGDVNVSGGGILNMQLPPEINGIFIDKFDKDANGEISAVFENVEINITYEGKIDTDNIAIGTYVHSLFFKNTKVSMKNCYMGIMSYTLLKIEKSSISFDSPIIADSYIFLCGMTKLECDIEPQGDVIFTAEFMGDPVPWGEDVTFVLTTSSANVDNYEEEKQSNIIPICILILILTASVASAGYFASKR